MRHHVVEDSPRLLEYDILGELAWFFFLDSFQRASRPLAAAAAVASSVFGSSRPSAAELVATAAGYIYIFLYICIVARWCL